MVKVLKKVLLCICIILILMNFTMYNTSFAGADNIVESAKTWYNNTAQFSIGTRIANGLSGIAGVLMTGPKLIAVAIAQIVQTVGAGMANIGRASGEPIIIALTPDDILFNEIGLTSIDFFNIEGLAEGNVIREIREQIALWYYVMRTIAIVILLIILIFVGIRMAITTVAAEKAIYKKALFDWFTSLALVFLLHYIIRGVLWINTALVDVLLDVNHEADMTEMIAALIAMVFDPDFCVGVGATIIYCIITAQTLMFLITYIKRVLVLAFLIIISPLITITYSIDKMGDQKAQALNTWLKEFSYNVLIQPFHCILYIVFVTIAIKSVNTIGSFGSMVLAILCIKFVWDGEKIVRKIFGFEQASSLAAAAASGAVIGSALNKAASAGKTAASGIKYANNSKTAKLLKDKYKNGKDKGLSLIDNMRYNIAEQRGNTGKMTAIEEASKQKRELKEAKAKVRAAARGNHQTPIRKMKETLKEKPIVQNTKKRIGKIKEGTKNFANSELGQAIGSDAQRFVRKLTTPENITKLGTAIFAGAATLAVPDSNLITAIGSGYTVGKAAENKVREIRNRKSENYEDDLVTACNTNSYATGIDMTNEKNRTNYMDTVMAEGKNDGYTQDNINKVQKDVADRLEKNATKLGINPGEINALLAKIKRDIVAGDGYSAKTLEGYGVDPNELNKIVGEFAAIVNNSLLFTKTDAFDTQMEPMGYDHDDVMNNIDVSKLGNTIVSEDKNVEIENMLKNVSTDDINTKSNDEIMNQIQTEIDDKLNQAISEIKNEVDNLDISNSTKELNEIKNELETNLQSAVNSGVSDLERIVHTTLNNLNVNYTPEQITQTITNSNITKVIEQKEIINNNTQTVINEIQKMRNR